MKRAGMVVAGLLSPAVAGCTLLLAGDAVVCDDVVRCPQEQQCQSGFCVGAGEKGEGEGEGEVGGSEGEGEGEGVAGEGEGEGEVVPSEGEGEIEPPGPPPQTCRELLERGEARDGAYGIDLSGDGVLGLFERVILGTTVTVNERDVFCDMNRKGGGWTRVAFFAPVEGATFTGNLAAPCLDGFQLEDFGGGNRGCSRAAGPASQPGILFPTLHGYTEVMGKVVGVVFGDGDAYAGLRNQTLNDVYVDGVSITTTAAGVDEHVFTLVSAHPLPLNEPCPCEAGVTVAAPAFVGAASICDKPTAAARPGAANELRAYDVANPIWDTDICGAAPDGVWTRATATAHVVTDDLVLRLMHDQETADENIALTRVELFIR